MPRSLADREAAACVRVIHPHSQLLSRTDAFEIHLPEEGLQPSSQASPPPSGLRLLQVPERQPPGSEPPLWVQTRWPFVGTAAGTPTAEAGPSRGDQHLVWPGEGKARWRLHCD